MQRARQYLFAVLCSGLLLLNGASVIHANSVTQTGISYGTNIVANGDAESGAGSDNGSTVPVPDWQVLQGAFTAVQYGANGGFPQMDSPGPNARGNNFFAGGDGVDASQAKQTIDLSSLAADIDTGKVNYVLQAYVGGFDTQADSSIVYASFKDQNGAATVSNNVGPVTPDDRQQVTGLLFRSTNGVVPAGTRTVEIYMNMTRVEGSYNDGYVDNISLVLSPKSVRLELPIVIKTN